MRKFYFEISFRDRQSTVRGTVEHKDKNRLIEDLIQSKKITDTEAKNIKEVIIA